MYKEKFNSILHLLPAADFMFLSKEKILQFSTFVFYTFILAFLIIFHQVFFSYFFFGNNKNIFLQYKKKLRAPEN